MKSLTRIAILAVAVLAVGSVAQAAVVDVELTFDKTTGITVGETLNWDLTILVTDNAYSFAGVGTFDLGVQAASIGLASDNAGIVEIEEGTVSFPPPGGPSGKPADGTVTPNVADEPTGFGAQALPISPAYTANRGLEPILLSGTITSGQEGWDGTTGPKAELQKGAGTAIVHMEGTMVALAEGVVTYTPSIVLNGDNYNLSIYTGDETAYTYSQRSVTASGDTLNLIGETLTVGGGVVTNPPTVGITTPDIVEGDWTGPNGWNNPARTVTIDAVGSDEDGGTQGLTWLWEINDGNGFKTVGTSADSMALTIQDLLDAGCVLPDPITDGQDHSTDPAYQWDLQVTVTDPDGSATDSMKIFVPEPTTMGLLGFGIVGTLLRRRRRA